MFNLIKRWFFSTSYKDVRIFYMFNFPFILNDNYSLSFYVMLGVFAVLGMYLVWSYMKNSKIITTYYDFIRVYTVKSFPKLHSPFIYNLISAFYLLLSFFFVIILQDLDQSFLDIWHLHLIFYVVDQESKASLLFFKTFFYTFVSLVLLVPFIVSFILFWYKVRFSVLQKRLLVLFMFCHSLFFYGAGIPTLRQLIFKSSNFVFLQNGLFINTLFECSFFKLGVTFFSADPCLDDIKNRMVPILNYILVYPNYNLRYLFDCAHNCPGNCDSVLSKMYNCLAQNDMNGANQTLQELCKWQGPWNIQDIIDIVGANKLDSSCMFGFDASGHYNINGGVNFDKVFNMIFNQEGFVKPGRFFEDGPSFSNYLQHCYQSTETQSFLAEQSYLMILAGVLLLLPPDSGKSNIGISGLALAGKFKQQGKTDFLNW